MHYRVTPFTKIESLPLRQSWEKLLAAQFHPAKQKVVKRDHVMVLTSSLFVFFFFFFFFFLVRRKS
jgi:hypothetical protein